MKNFKNLIMVALFFVTATILAQTKISGKVVDEIGEPLPGASILVKGTSSGVETDFDGNFALTTNLEKGTIIVSFVGYQNSFVTFTKESDLGTIQLIEDKNLLDEIIIKGLVDVAKDRQTPVAVSTIKASEIQEKLGSQEFPEILNSTPSVYATKSGGGFGDARINIRGFDQVNTAVLINGVPVNDMENGAVFWSNWAGLSDVTTAMQVQRGLGSSKLAISSVGGTINVITKTTDKKEGGLFSVSYGNDNYLKTLASYSTGKNEKGFAASFLLSRTAGEGYVDGTEFEGYNYFVGLGWELNEKHDIQFMLTGAPQTHNQRTTSFFNMATLDDYLEYGEKYNYNHGYLDGEEFNWRKNFYHKPLSSINWNWNISDKSSLSTSAYVSFGRGGGTGDIGRLDGNFASDRDFRDENGLVLWDEIIKSNSGTEGVFNNGFTYNNTPDFETGTFIVNDDEIFGDREPFPWESESQRLDGVNRRNGFIRRASVNSHNWFGVLSNFNTELNEKLSLDFGVDLRSYKGIHYRRVDNLLGSDGYRDNDDVNNPFNVVTQVNESNLGGLWNVFKSTDDEEKINYYNDGLVRWAGAFTQLEYSDDKFSGFIQAAVSQQSLKRIDYFNYLDSDPLQETDWQNFLGGNLKGGLNVNIDEKNNVFANVGYYSKQPQFDSVFLNFVNDINEDAVNEKVFGAEIGYGLNTDNLKLNLNAYRTEWKDRFVSFGFENEEGEEGDAQLNGITQLHMGVELDVVYDVLEDVKLLGTVSYGDWTYQGSITGTAFDQDQNEIGTIDLDVTDVAVGNSAQTNIRLGVEAEPFKNFKVDFNQRFNDRLYSDLVIDDSLDGEATTLDPAIELPGYSVSDLGFSYKWLFKKKEDQSLNFRLNINNLFNQSYIAESATNYAAEAGDETFKGINTSNKVFFGFRRTWNFSVRYNF